jgi:hypothetical protein
MLKEFSALRANIRPVQCVASPGGGPRARSTTGCTVAAGSGGLPGLRVLSRGQAGETLPHEALLPAPHHRLGLAGSPHDLGRAAAISGREDDFGAPNMLLRRVAIANNRLKLTVTSTTIPALIMRA